MRLSNDLGIGYIAKDSLKELLGDTLYVQSEDIEPYFYGDASVTALFAVIKSFIPSNKTMFVENAFWYDLATERLSSLVQDTDTKLLQVYVTCDYQEATRRFRDRITSGMRHHIHPDTVYSNVSPDANKLKYRALDIHGMETRSFDTTNSTDEDYQALVGWLKQETGGKV